MSTPIRYLSVHRQRAFHLLEHFSRRRDTIALSSPYRNRNIYNVCLSIQYINIYRQRASHLLKHFPRRRNALALYINIYRYTYK